MNTQDISSYLIGYEFSLALRQSKIPTSSVVLGLNAYRTISNFQYSVRVLNFLLGI